MAEHTKGPWTVGEEVASVDRLVYIPIRSGRNNVSLTGVYGRKPNGETAGAKYTDRFGTERHKPSISADECRANARLIAAAPLLLAACEAGARALKTYIDEIDPEAVDPDDDDVRALGLMRAAIARARGEAES